MAISDLLFHGKEREPRKVPLFLNILQPALLFSLFTVLLFSNCSSYSAAASNDPEPVPTNLNSMTDTATFANGCFWCTEAVFTELKGVIKVTSGFSGGKTENPTYKQVCTGETGHAECLQIIYDPSVISFDELLEVFWETHDPTTLNRQGNDIGTQYRSAIFYHNDEQKQKAEKYKSELDKSGSYDNPVVTEIVPFKKFFPAEDYLQDYFENNENTNPYCRMVIRPKVDKFRKVFKDKLKKEFAGDK